MINCFLVEDDSLIISTTYTPFGKLLTLSCMVLKLVEKLAVDILTPETLNTDTDFTGSLPAAMFTMPLLTGLGYNKIPKGFVEPTIFTVLE